MRNNTLSPKSTGTQMNVTKASNQFFINRMTTMATSMKMSAAIVIIPPDTAS